MSALIVILKPAPPLEDYLETIYELKDLPGTHSLSSLSPEERMTQDELPGFQIGSLLT